MTREAVHLAEIVLAVGAEPGIRLFRNNTGAAWVGDIIQKTPDHITLRNYRRIRFGLIEGGGDLIGWQQQGLFTSLEVKTDIGRPSIAQTRFRDAVLLAGGVAGIVRTPADARLLLGIK